MVSQEHLTRRSPVSPRFLQDKAHPVGSRESRKRQADKISDSNPEGPPPPTPILAWDSPDTLHQATHSVTGKPRPHPHPAYRLWHDLLNIASFVRFARSGSSWAGMDHVMVVGEQMAAEESGDQSVESRIVERHNVLAAPPSWGSDIGIGLLPTNDFLSFFCSPSSIPMSTWHHTSRNSPPARSSTNAEESSGLVQHVIISPNLACPHRTRPCRWLVTIPSTVGTTYTQQQAAAGHRHLIGQA